MGCSLVILKLYSNHKLLHEQVILFYEFCLSLIYLKRFIAATLKPEKPTISVTAIWETFKHSGFEPNLSSFREFIIKQVLQCHIGERKF